jgi:hypothetical protein
MREGGAQAHGSQNAEHPMGPSPRHLLSSCRALTSWRNLPDSRGTTKHAKGWNNYFLLETMAFNRFRS